MDTQSSNNNNLLPGSTAPSLKDRPIDWMKANPIPSAIAGLVVLGLFTGGGSNYQEGAQQQRSIADFKNQARYSIKASQLDQKLREEQFEIAVQRQRMGCILLTTDGNTPANVVEGLVVSDPTTGKPLPQGTPVCDIYGWTAILNPNGQMTDLLQGKVSSSVQMINVAPVPVPRPTPITIYAPESSSN